MSFTTLSRLGGIALVLGGLLQVAGFVLHPGGTDPSRYTATLWLPANLLILVGALLVALGLPMMYARQAERAGKLGLIGFVLTFLVVLMFNLVLGGSETFLLPALAADPSAHSLLAAGPPASEGRFILLALLFELVGSITYGIATLRAGVYPRVVGILFLAVPVLAIVGSIVTLPGPLAQLDGVALDAAVIVAGVSMLSRSVVTAPATAAALAH